MLAILEKIGNVLLGAGLVYLMIFAIYARAQRDEARREQKSGIRSLFSKDE
jgi:hypothetical protein